MNRGCTMVVTLALAVLFYRAAVGADAPGWKGVDETVIEKTAAEAGRPPREPYLDTDQGDLLLFLFLISGAVGGFVAGYAFRTLFPPIDRRKINEEES